MDDNTRDVVSTGITVLATLVGVAIGAVVTWQLERSRRDRDDRQRIADRRANAYQEWRKASGEAQRLAFGVAESPGASLTLDHLFAGYADGLPGVELFGSPAVIDAATRESEAWADFAETAVAHRDGRRTDAQFKAALNKYSYLNAAFLDAARVDIGLESRAVKEGDAWSGQVVTPYGLRERVPTKAEPGTTDKV